MATHNLVGLEIRREVRHDGTSTFDLWANLSPKVPALVAWPGPVFSLGPSSCAVFSIQLSSTCRRWYKGPWLLISCAGGQGALWQPRPLCWKHEAHLRPWRFYFRWSEADVDLLSPRAHCREVTSRTEREIIWGCGNTESSRNAWLNFTTINQRDKYPAMAAAQMH